MTSQTPRKENDLNAPWEVVIGLEIHAQISSHSKLFSPSPTCFGSAPNSQVSFIDAALPGTLPVVNQRCIEAAIQTGLSVEGTINRRSIFARKNYFYPDLPQGYQISQYEEPIVREGRLKISMKDGAEKTIRIERIHMEQDAGKSLHDQAVDVSLIDLNRSGVGLMEIVTYPDLASPEEASTFVSSLRTLLRTIGVCDGNMQEGSLRVDANISVRQPGESLGTRCEIKNLNSIKFLRQAIVYESERQIALIKQGGSVVQETRLFQTDTGKTQLMRSKEDAPDYRYFPDPDLCALPIGDEEIEAIRVKLPELPQAKALRYQQDMELKPADAEFLVSEPAITDYFETALSARRGAQPSAKMLTSWILSELLGFLNRDRLEISASRVSAPALVSLLEHVSSGRISGAQAKKVFASMWTSNQSADSLIQELGLEQIQDDEQISSLIRGVIADSPKQVATYRSGNTNVFGWFVGQVMKASKGKANPRLVSKLVSQALDDHTSQLQKR